MEKGLAASAWLWAILSAGAAAGALGVAAPAAAAQAAPAARLSVPPLDYRMRKLDNGLTVYTMRDSSTPNVLVSMWYEVGSKHDPHRRSGFAHLFEHILSRKTVNMPYNMINRLVENVGGSRNASTWYDRTNYYEIVPARYLETMLWTHAERMARPVVDAQIFEGERGVVKEEYRQGVLAPPYGRLRLMISENSWDRMPHRRPGIGSMEDLDAARLEDARAFHEAYYGPDTAALIVSGNFDEKQLDEWIDRYFAKIPPRTKKTPLAIEEKEPQRTQPRLATMYAPNVPLPAVGSTWRVPGAAHPDMPALMVLNAILTRGESSRLYRALIKEQQLATQLNGDLSDVEEGGYYAPWLVLAGGKSVAAAEAALAAEIARMREAPVTAAELAEAKNELLALALRQRETFDGRAFNFGEMLVRTGDPKAADKRLSAIQRVGIPDVQRVARKYLAPAARVDFRYLDESARNAGSQAAGEQAATWLNPVPMPTFKSVPPATRPPLEVAAEGQRVQPPAPGAPVPVTPPVISETKLPTGLSVVTARTGDVPLATMGFVVKGGAAAETRDKAGLASLAADLVTQGTKTRSAERIAAELESLGATIGTGAGADGAFVVVSAPLANLDAAAAILADVVQNPSFPEAEVELQRKRSLDSLSVALKNPAAIAAMAAEPLLYGAAPYGIVATPASLRAVTRQDLAEHHRRWWHPANAALVVSGGIDPARANTLAARLFGGWRGEGPAPQLPASRAGEAQPARTVVIDLPGAGQAAVRAAVRAIGRADPDYYSLSVANAVLGGGSTGRLFQEVRTKRSLSYGSYSAVPPRMEASVLSATAQTKNESAAEVAEVMLAELDRLGKEPLAADAVENKTAYITGAYNRQVETSGGLGSVLANLVQQGLPPSEATQFVERMEAVTPAAATAVAGRLVSGERATLVVVGDAAQFVDKLRAIRPNLEVIPAAEFDPGSPTLRRRP